MSVGTRTDEGDYKKFGNNQVLSYNAKILDVTWTERGANPNTWLKALMSAQDDELEAVLDKDLDSVVTFLNRITPLLNERTSVTGKAHNHETESEVGKACEDCKALKRFIRNEYVKTII